MPLIGFSFNFFSLVCLLVTGFLEVSAFRLRYTRLHTTLDPDVVSGARSESLQYARRHRSQVLIDSSKMASQQAPQRGRFYVEKFLGLKHSVGVACIGCVYLSKAAGAFTFAVALLIAQALEPRFENLYDPVAGSFSWGGFTYTDECIADETCAASFLAKTRDALA